MKKLLVVALSALMVLAFAAASMAAVVTSGECNFGWNLGPDANQDEFGDAKVAVTADVSDTMQVFAALKGNVADVVSVDEAWASFKADTITTKVGYFGFNLDGDVDIISSVNEIKRAAGISVTGKAADAITVAGYLARFGDNVGVDTNEMQSIYAFSVAYDTDSFGGKLAYSSTTVEDTTGITSLSGYYKMDAFKVYLTYETIGDQPIGVGGAKVDCGSNAVLGASYDSDSFYGRVETQVVKYTPQDDADVDANIGFRLGYKLNSNAKIEYNSKTIYADVDGGNPDAEAETSIKLCVTF